MNKNFEKSVFQTILKIILVFIIPTITISLFLLSYFKLDNSISQEEYKYRRPEINEVSLFPFINYGPIVNQQEVLITFLESFLPQITKEKNVSNEIQIFYKFENNNFYIKTILNSYYESFYIFRLEQNNEI